MKKKKNQEKLEWKLRFNKRSWKPASQISFTTDLFSLKSKARNVQEIYYTTCKFSSRQDLDIYCF